MKWWGVGGFSNIVDWVMLFLEYWRDKIKKWVSLKVKVRMYVFYFYFMIYKFRFFYNLFYFCRFLIFFFIEWNWLNWFNVFFRVVGRIKIYDRNYFISGNELYI